MQVIQQVSDNDNNNNDNDDNNKEEVWGKKPSYSDSSRSYAYQSSNYHVLQ